MFKQALKHQLLEKINPLARGARTDYPALIQT